MTDTSIGNLPAQASAQSASGDFIAVEHPATASTKKMTFAEAGDAFGTHGALVKKSSYALKGDILVATATGVVTNLGVGTNGQGIVADSTQASGVKWGTISGTGIALSTVTAKGDLIAATANATVTNLPVGANDLVLTADSTQASGLGWRYVYARPLTVNAQTGTTYTPVLGDAGQIVTLSNAAAITLTIPLNASVAYPVGTSLTFSQIGVGQVTIASSATLNTAASLKTRTQFSYVQAVKRATDTWDVYGDLEPLGQSINAQTGTAYTFVLSDADDLVTLTNAAAIAATVPPNSSVAYPIGTHIDFVQYGVGQVTIVAGAGVTVNATPTLKTRAQNSAGSLVKTATNVWLLLGDLASS